VNLDMNIPAYYRYLSTLLELGEPLVYPTEAVWGLGCDPANELAVMRLCALKGRAHEKGLILIAANVDQVRVWVPSLTQQMADELTRPQPRPTTYVIEHKGGVPEWVSGGRETVAVRISSHPDVINLCNAFGGAIVSTSANISGHQSATLRAQIEKDFSGIAIAPGELGGETRPSKIINLTTGEIIRE